MLNIRTVILSVALVVILMVAVPLVTARTEIVSDPSSNPASGLEVQEGPANIIDTYRARSYRSNYGERQVPIASYRSPLDVCYDVPLKDANSCRNASQASIPLYRSPLDVCYDVSLSEAAACRLSEQARSNR
jgi:hypothetical protein